MAKKLKIGLIGTGGISTKAHLPNYQAYPDLCEVVWAADVNGELAEKVAKEHGIAKWTADYREMLADPELDAVTVGTPNAYHKQPTIDALKAGKHVLCEKPLAMNGAECKEMCAAERDSGKILCVTLNNRFSPGGLFMKKFIDAGNLGDLYYGRAQALRRRGVPGWGVFIDKEKQGGGPLIDIGVHMLDFTLHLMGYPKPVSVSGMTWDKLGKTPGLFNFFGDYDRSKFTVEDAAVALIRFDNGAVVTLESSFMLNIGEREDWKCEIFGTKGGAVASPGGQNIQVAFEDDQQLWNMTPQNLPENIPGHKLLIKAFLEAIHGGLPSPVPSSSGLILNSVFDAIYKSGVTGNEEKVDLSF